MTFPDRWDDAQPLDTCLYSLMFHWLRDTLQPVLVNAPGSYPEPDEDEPSNIMIVHKPESNENTISRAPPPAIAGWDSLLPGQVRHWIWSLTMSLVDHWDTFYQYAEMSNKQHTEIHPRSWDSPNASEFVTSPKVCRTDLNLNAAYHPVTTQKI